MLGLIWKRSLFLPMLCFIFVSFLQPIYSQEEPTGERLKNIEARKEKERLVIEQMKINDRIKEIKGFIAGGNFQEALDNLNDLEIEYSRDKIEEYYKLKGKLEYELGKYDEAEDDLNKAKKQTPEDLEISILLVKLFIKTKSYEDAEEYLLKESENNPNSQELKIVLLDFYISNKKNEKANEIVKQVKINEDTPPQIILAYFDAVGGSTQKEKRFLKLYLDKANNFLTPALSLYLFILENEDCGYFEDVITYKTKTYVGAYSSLVEKTERGKLTDEDEYRYEITKSDGKKVYVNKQGAESVDIKKGVLSKIGAGVNELFTELKPFSQLDTVKYSQTMNRFLEKYLPLREDVGPDLKKRIELLLATYISDSYTGATEANMAEIDKIFLLSGFLTMENRTSRLPEQEKEYLELAIKAKTAMDKKSIILFERSMKKFEKKDTYYFILGIAYARNGQFEKSYKALTKFIRKEKALALLNESAKKLLPRIKAMIPCKKCKGAGVIPCPKCKGYKKYPCPSCGGAGYKVSGFGLSRKKTECTKCNGKKFFDCDKCEQKGFVDCPKCDKPYNQIIMENSPLWIGGVCQNCGGKGYTAELFSNICPSCGGIGQYFDIPKPRQIEPSEENDSDINNKNDSDK